MHFAVLCETSPCSCHLDTEKGEKKNSTKGERSVGMTTAPSQSRKKLLGPITNLWSNVHTHRDLTCAQVTYTADARDIKVSEIRGLKISLYLKNLLGTLGAPSENHHAARQRTAIWRRAAERPLAELSPACLRSFSNNRMNLPNVMKRSVPGWSGNLCSSHLNL